MKLLKYFRVAVESIIAHKLRAALTMLGIIIGIAAVLTTVGIGSGAAADITERIESSGTNLLTINAGASRGQSDSAGSLTIADAQVLADPTLFPDIAQLAPLYSANATLTNGGLEGSYSVVGTTANYADVANKTVELGEFLSIEQVEGMESVVVLGSTVATDLFGNLDPIGQTIRIDMHLFEVIGLLEESGGAFGSSDSQVFVPIEVAQGRLFNAPRHRGSYTVSSISVQAINGESLDSAELAIEQMLRLRHELGSNEENGFTITNQADLLEIAGDVSGTLTSLLGSIGAVSLIVGGIGIMNIMLVSVTERTREIGLRKALGAHDSDVLLQFLIEALVLTSLGGLIGIGLSFGLANLVSGVEFVPFSIIIEPWAVMLALLVSSASGFIFGLYPAMRATRLDPIDALRFE
ncbi:MAG: ABC transporter permease [Chloroflexota bacterium]